MEYQEWLLWTNFRICRCIGVRPASVSTAPVGEVLNAPRIQIAAHLCIRVSSFRVPLYLAPLKNQSLIPYVAIGRMHDQYSRHLCLGHNPRLELPRDAIAIAAENNLVAYIFACSVKRSLQLKKNARYLQRCLGTRGVSPVYGAYPRSTGTNTSALFLEKWNASDLSCSSTGLMAWVSWYTVE